MNNKLEDPKRKLNDFLEPIVSKEKRESISRDAKWAAIALSIISFLGQQFILNTKTVKKLYAPVENYLNPGVASLDDYISIGNTFIASAPLIIVFAIFYLVLKGKSERGEGLAPGHFWVGAVLLYIGASFGNAAGFASVRTAGIRGGNPLTAFSLILSDYYNSYGFILFLSSLVVGVFLGRAWKTLFS